MMRMTRYIWGFPCSIGFIKMPQRNRLRVIREFFARRETFFVHWITSDPWDTDLINISRKGSPKVIDVKLNFPSKSSDGNKKGPEATFLIGAKRGRDFNLTNACNSGLQVTPYRNYGSGLSKEAYINISNFRANLKWREFGICSVGNRWSPASQRHNDATKTQAFLKNTAKWFIFQTHVKMPILGNFCGILPVFLDMLW